MFKVLLVIHISYSLIVLSTKAQLGDTIIEDFSLDYSLFLIRKI